MDKYYLARKAYEAYRKSMPEEYKSQAFNFDILIEPIKAAWIAATNAVVYEVERNR